ncbi:MAG: peroxiredoxin-like family protein [Pseudomonadota bacterium]
MLTPRQKTSNLTLPLTAGGEFDLASDGGSRGTLVVFYRGLHCPICVPYLQELGKLTPEFEARGVNTIAISSDTAERAAEMEAKVKEPALRFAHSLTLPAARDWGLFVSAGIGKTSIGLEEPALFSEPGLFLVHPDLSLYFSAVQTMPFARPHFAEILKALDFVIAKGYPARGEYTGPVETAA